MSTQTHPPDGEAGHYNTASLDASRMRRYEPPDAVAAFNRDVAEKGQLVACVLARIAGRLVLIDGYRRLAAVKAAGGDTILAYVNPAVTTEAQAVAFLFNSEERQGRHPLDLAQCLEDYLSATGQTQAQAAQEMKLSPAKVSQCLRLLELPLEVRHLLAAGRITAEHCAVVASFDIDRRAALLAEAADKGLSTRALRALAKPRKAKPPPRVRRVEAAGATLVFNASLPVGTLRSALAEITQQVDARLKAADKGAISAGELFK